MFVTNNISNIHTQIHHTPPQRTSFLRSLASQNYVLIQAEKYVLGFKTVIMKSFIFPRNRIVVRNKGSDFYICPHSFSSCHLTASVRMNNNARNSRWEIFLRVTPPISAPDLGSSLRYYKSLNFCAMDLKFWRYVSNSIQFFILKEFFDILKNRIYIYF